MNEPIVCAMNIGTKEQQKRRLFGIIMLIISFILLGWLVVANIPVFWRLALFFPFWVSMLGFFQAKEKT